MVTVWNSTHRQGCSKSEQMYCCVSCSVEYTRRTAPRKSKGSNKGSPHPFSPTLLILKVVVTATRAALWWAWYGQSSVPHMLHSHLTGYLLLDENKYFFSINYRLDVF